MICIANRFRMYGYFPEGLKAAVMMTGDDHNLEVSKGFTGTPSRFNDYRLMSKDNSHEAVEDWRAIRATSYVV